MVVVLLLPEVLLAVDVVTLLGLGVDVTVVVLIVVVF